MQIDSQYEYKNDVAYPSHHFDCEGRIIFDLTPKKYTGIVKLMVT